ncbi:aspartic peptidase domain-containing protein [Russula brevipes]|nr:aspartic peptidase domain-containing protein [Russula brevipes]
MYIFAPFVLLSFSSIAVQAASTPASSGLSLPLTRRSKPHNSNHVENFRRHIDHATPGRRFARAPGEVAISHSPLGKRASLGCRGASEPLNFLSDVSVWTCDIKIGPTTFKILPSTASPDLIVPDTGCTKCGNITHFYDPKKSSGKDLNRTVDETYNAGVVAGKLYEDAVSIAGLTAQHQTFVAATAYPPTFGYSPGLDGFLGLSFSSLSPIKATPLFQSLLEQKKIAHAVFGVSLAPNCPELYLGGTNQKYHDGDFADFDVLATGQNPGYWMVEANAVSVGGVEAIRPKIANVDTGTNFVIADNGTASEFYKSIHGSWYYGEGYWAIPCGFDKDVTFTFSGNERGFTIPPSVFKLPTRDVTRCYGAIVGAALPEGHITLGDIFLRNVYTKFDFTKRQVGFAAPRNC